MKEHKYNLVDDAERLPKWAQQQVATLMIERDCAIRELNEYRDEQTPAQFYRRD